jgi:hypothetical protein
MSTMILVPSNKTTAIDHMGYVPARKEAVPLAMSVPAFAGKILDRSGMNYFLNLSEPVGACFLLNAIIAMSRRMPYHPSDIPRTEPQRGHVPMSSSRAAPKSWDVISLGIVIGGTGYFLPGVACLAFEIIQITTPIKTVRRINARGRPQNGHVAIARDFAPPAADATISDDDAAENNVVSIGVIILSQLVNNST